MQGRHGRFCSVKGEAAAFGEGMWERDREVQCVHMPGDIEERKDAGSRKSC